MADKQAITIRLATGLYENLRHEAYVTRRHMSEIVTESVAARYAGKHKVIHHIDGDPGNNDPANLVLMDADDHGQPKENTR